MVVTRSHRGENSRSQETVEETMSTETRGTIAAPTVMGSTNSGTIAATSRSKPARSRRSITSRRRLREELEVKERLAELEIQRLQAAAALEQVRLERIHAESDTSGDESEELASQSQQRVNKWLERQSADAAPDELGTRDAAPEPATEEPTAHTEKGRGQGARVIMAHGQRDEPPARQSSAVDVTSLATALADAVRVSGKSAPKFLQELPPFSGRCHEWLSFKAAFRDTENRFTATENVARIRVSLKGIALEAVSALLISQPAPQAIITALERRFGRPDNILLHEIEKVKMLPRLAESARDLCVFANRIANVVATVEVLNKPQYLHNPEMLRIIVDKLNPILRSKWYDYAANSDDAPELQKIAAFLNSEADKCAAYALPEINSGESEKYVKSDKSEHRMQRRRSERTYVAAAVTQACPSCKQKHYLTACPQFLRLDVHKRWEVAKQNKMCFKCLASTHRRLNCRAKPCGYRGCTMRHHRLLHAENIVNIASQPLSPVTPTERPPQPAPLAQPTLHSTEQAYYAPALPLAPLAQSAALESRAPLAPLPQVLATAKDTIAVATHIRVLLKIVPVILRGPLATVETFALLDEGSTVTIVDVSLANILGLEGPTEPMWVQGIGGTEINYEKSRRVNFNIKGKYSDNEFVAYNARTVERLGFKPQSVNELDLDGCEYLGDIKRELVYENAIPRVLIGQDNWDMIVSRAIRSGRRDQLVASQTQLGWVLHGCRTTQAVPIMFCSNLKTIERVNNLLQSGYAERAPTPSSGRTWYLPHFPVINPEKPKIRLVHDAAAKSHGRSLNDMLLQGPDLLQSLPGVIMRFRQYAIAVSADIKEMFMQIKIRSEDRDALRFLWRGERREGDAEEYRMTAVVFGASSSPCTALYIKNKNAQDYAAEYPQAAIAIERHHYMDDYLQSFKCIKDSREITRSVDYVHKQAGFILTGWATNNSDAIATYEATSEPASIHIGRGGSECDKTLGILWNVEGDYISFRLNQKRATLDVMNGQRIPTKREALSIIMSVFDPLGLLSPVTTPAKRILQDAWRYQTNWDDAIPRELQTRWENWLRTLRSLEDLRIPRCYDYGSVATYEMHTFVDASEEAYVAAVYWRTTCSDGTVRVSLAAAKSRVTPNKPISIPRLELQAAVLGVRLATTVAREHDFKVTNKIYWSDSRTALAWIRAEPRTFKTFVAHRLAEIEENTKKDEWRWVPTADNVADDATRATPTGFHAQHRWFVGPTFLYQDKSEWPAEEKKEVDSTCELLVQKCATIQVHEHTHLPQLHRFSKWTRLIRATARILQFTEICRRNRGVVAAARRKRTKKNATQDSTWGEPAVRTTRLATTTAAPTEVRKYLRLEAHYLIAAERLWIRAMQQDAYACELELIKRGQALNKDDRLANLSLFTDDYGLIRVKERITAADAIQEETANPAVLCGKHSYTRLYIQHVQSDVHSKSLILFYDFLELTPHVIAAGH